MGSDPYLPPGVRSTLSYRQVGRYFHVEIATQHAPRNLDEARLMPRYRAPTPAEREARASLLAGQRRALVDAAVSSARGASGNADVAPEPGELRGIPVVGRGVSGASPGTHPEREVVRRSAKTVSREW